MNNLFLLFFLIQRYQNSRFIEEKHLFDQEAISFLGKFFSINGKITLTLDIDIQYTYLNPPKGLKYLDLSFIMIDYEYYNVIVEMKDINNIERCRRMLHNSIYIKEIDVVFEKKKRTFLNNKAIHNNHNPTLWYFLLLDCNLHTHHLFPDFPFIITDLTVTDDTSSHFSYEEKFILQSFSVLILVFIFILGINCKFILKEFKKEEPNYHLIICYISLLIKFLYICLQTIHLYIYSTNGLGSWTLDIVSIVVWSLSQYFLASLILFTIAGWGIFYRSILQYDYLYPSIIIVFLIQSVSLVLTEYNENSIDKFHDFDGLTGSVINISKSFFFVLILFSLNKIMTKINKHNLSNKKLKDFYFNLAIVGILYTMSFPLLCFMVNYLDYFYRHKVIVCSDIILQVLCVIALLKMFGSKTNAFSEYSIYVDPLTTECPRKEKSK
jgi:hypothetical protein